MVRHLWKTWGEAAARFIALSALANKVTLPVDCALGDAVR